MHKSILEVPTLQSRLADGSRSLVLAIAKKSTTPDTYCYYRRAWKYTMDVPDHKPLRFVAQLQCWNFSKEAGFLILH